MQLEHLPNEILYDIYHALTNLNERLENLLYAPIFSISADCSLISKSNFEEYFTDIILSNLYRMKSLHLSTLSPINILLLSLDNFIQLTRLETLLLNNIPSIYLEDLR